MKQTTTPAILVAVYGTLRKGHGNWYRLLNNSQSEFLGECKTEPKYSMYHLGGFPAVQEKGDTSITIEVFRVTESVKENLDMLEGYQGKGQRNFYDITTVETTFGEATMYVINDRSFSKNTLIQTGDWNKQS